jgi:hypothetical protein
MLVAMISMGTVYQHRVILGLLRRRDAVQTIS